MSRAERSIRTGRRATPVSRVSGTQGRGGTVHPMRATLNGSTIAESDETVVVEGNHYFPRASLAEGITSESDTTSVCPWKGTAAYLTLTVDGEENVDAAWFYPAPKDAAAEIKDHVAFGEGVEVTG